MKKVLVLICILLFVGALFVAGCEKKSDAAAGTVLCAQCGQVKDSAQCCNPDAEKCVGCNLAKGSPACCKHLDFSKGDVKLCSPCGQVKGSAKCCAADAEKCPKCNLAKGSPGCCAI